MSLIVSTAYDSWQGDICWQEEANRGKPNWEHLDDELHVLIQVYMHDEWNFPWRYDNVYILVWGHCKSGCCEDASGCRACQEATHSSGWCAQSNEIQLLIIAARGHWWAEAQAAHGVGDYQRHVSSFPWKTAQWWVGVGDGRKVITLYWKKQLETW